MGSGSPLTPRGQPLACRWNTRPPRVDEVVYSPDTVLGWAERHKHAGEPDLGVPDE